MQKIMFVLMKHKLLLLAIFVTFFTHLTYLRAGFVWIDHNDIEEKHAIVPIQEIPNTFLMPFGETSFYRPIVVIVNSIDYVLYELNPIGFHFTNLLLHIIVVILVAPFLVLFYQLTDIQKLIARLFVGVHPMSILIVGAITRRQETLGAIFIMLSVIAYVYARKRSNLKFTLAFCGIFFFALCVKETSLVIVPALIILWEVIQKKFTLIKNIRVFISASIPVTTYFLLRMRAVPEVWNTEITQQLTASEYVATRIGLLGKWLLYSINPLKPDFTDAVSVLRISDPSVILFFLVLCALLLFICRIGVRNPFSIGVMLTFLLIAPGLALIPVPRMGTPNYGYLPVLGMAMVIVVIWSLFEEKYTRSLIFAGALWFLVACAVTFVSGDRFKNDFTLFSPEVEKQYFPEGNYFLGNYYVQHGEHKKAQEAFKRSLENDESKIAFRNDLPTRINLASVSMQRGENKEARELLYHVLNDVEDSQIEMLTFNLAITFHNEEKYKEVIEILESREWSFKGAYLMLADSYGKIGLVQKKKEALTKADSF
jgi:protein O-mannosyl-transferase